MIEGENRILYVVPQPFHMFCGRCTYPFYMWEEYMRDTLYTDGKQWKASQVYNSVFPRSHIVSIFFQPIYIKLLELKHGINLTGGASLPSSLQASNAGGGGCKLRHVSLDQPHFSCLVASNGRGLGKRQGRHEQVWNNSSALKPKEESFQITTGCE